MAASKTEIKKSAEKTKTPRVPKTDAEKHTAFQKRAIAVIKTMTRSVVAMEKLPRLRNAAGTANQTRAYREAMSGLLVRMERALDPVTVAEATVAVIPSE